MSVPAVIRIRSGTPTDTEIAALVLALISTRAGGRRPADLAPVARPAVPVPSFGCPRSWQQRS